MKKTIICLITLLAFCLIILAVLPFIEFKNGNTITAFKYKDIIDEFETYTCYGESVSYNKEKDISITNYSINKMLFLYKIEMEYEKGNLCDTEYVLEESYIKNFLENAEIKSNEQNIDLEKLIEGRKPIVGNTKYLGNDYTKGIFYILDKKHSEMYIFYVDDLLVIQVGSFDDGAKFIAYK